MNSNQQTRNRAIWLAVALSFLTALIYLMMGMNILAVGDLTAAEGPPGIIYVAAGCYVVGGLLILLRWRWLWVAGAAMNALVMFAFLQFYMERPAVLFSPGGLASKAAQLLLEGLLIYLILTHRRAAAPQPLGGQLEMQS
jgi:hypothetical protein